MDFHTYRENTRVIPILNVNNYLRRYNLAGSDRAAILCHEVSEWDGILVCTRQLIIESSPVQ